MFFKISTNSDCSCALEIFFRIFKILMMASWDKRGKSPDLKLTSIKLLIFLKQLAQPSDLAPMLLTVTIRLIAAHIDVEARVGVLKSTIAEIGIGVSFRPLRTWPIGF